MTPLFVHQIGRLVQQAERLHNAIGVRLDKPISWNIVIPVDGTLFTMQAISVASEDYEVIQKDHSLTVAIRKPWRHATWAGAA
jgi:hypothetical protein